MAKQGIEWKVVLRGVTQRSYLSCRHEFQNLLQVQMPERGFLIRLCCLAERKPLETQERWEKAIWAINPDAVRMLFLEIGRKREQQMRRTGMVYVQSRSENGQAASPWIGGPNGPAKAESRLAAG
jgi:hypothetical protein